MRVSSKRGRPTSRMPAIKVLLIGQTKTRRCVQVLQGCLTGFFLNRIARTAAF